MIITNNDDIDARMIIMMMIIAMLIILMKHETNNIDHDTADYNSDDDDDDDDDDNDDDDESRRTLTMKGVFEIDVSRSLEDETEWLMVDVGRCWMTNKMTRLPAANVMPVVVGTKCRHWQTHSLVWVALAAPSSERGCKIIFHNAERHGSGHLEWPDAKTAWPLKVKRNA